jgi:peptidyl-prolyl cis-trans isomerase C
VNRIQTALTGLIALSMTVSMWGCQTEKKDEKSVSGDVKTDTAGTTTTTTREDAAKLRSELDDLPQLAPIQSVNLVKMPNNLIICTVDGSPVTVNTFKREFQAAIVSLQSMLSIQPEKMDELLAQAKANGMSLTEDEKNRMLKSAHSPQALEGKPLATFLKEKKMTEAQFNEQVLNLGLAFKCGTKLIESQLLSEMINREIVLKEATKAGLKQKAVNDFVAIKNSKKYKQFVESSSSTPEQVRDEIIQSQMIKLMMEKLAKGATVSDQEVAQQYEKNKERFKHGERVRISHIVVAAPMVDYGPLQSMKTQIQAQRPELKGEALEAETKVVKQMQYEKAKGYLKQAQSGADFKTLADNYSEDEVAKKAKTGGDVGYMDLSSNLNADQLKIMAAVSKLKAGEIAPEVIETNYGYHVVKVTERQPGGYRTLSEVKPLLQDALTQRSQAESVKKWIDERRKKADIKLTDEFLKASAATPKDSVANDAAAQEVAKNAADAPKAKGNGTVNQ